MVYQWKPSARIKAKAEDAAAVFDQLERSGGLTPGRVVEASRPKGAPLHGEFEWNDKIAASQYREVQARYLIRNLVVVNETDSGGQQAPTRAYFAVSEPCEYTHITKVLSDEEMTEKLLEQAIKELVQFKRKYSSLKSLANLFNEIDQFVDQTKIQMPADKRAEV